MRQHFGWLALPKRQVGSPAFMGARSQPVFWWLAWTKMAAFEVCLLGAESERNGGSLWREGSYRETCLWEPNHSVLVAGLRELAATGRHVLVGCNRSVLVCRCGEEAVFGRRMLMGAESQRCGRSLFGEEAACGSYYTCEVPCFVHGNGVLVADFYTGAQERRHTLPRMFYT